MKPKRIIELQRQVKVGRIALSRIADGDFHPQSIATEALEDMLPLDPKQSLQGLVGHLKSKGRG